VILIKSGCCDFFWKRLAVFGEGKFRKGGVVAESELHDIVSLIIENSCIFLILISTVYVTQHGFWSIGDEEWFWLIEEEDEALLVIAYDFLPEVFTL
jgi:hypothetical protein